MFTTCCMGGQVETTQAPVAYQIEETIENGQECYTSWIYDHLTTNGELPIISDTLGTILIVSNGRDKPEFIPFQTNTKGKSVLDKIESRILNGIRFPSHWADEGVAQPNMACKLKANEICKHIFEVYEKIPDRIAASKEDGIFIAFDSESGNKSLYIEIYNDLEAGYLLNDNENKQIISSDTIAEFEFGDIFQFIND